MSILSYFKQFSLAKVHNLVLFDQLIGPYLVLPILTRVDLRAMAVKRYSVFPQSSSITGALPSDCLVSFQDSRLEVPYSLQRSNPYILQPQTTGPLGERDLPLCRVAVGVFCSSSRLDKISLEVIIMKAFR